MHAYYSQYKCVHNVQFKCNMCIWYYMVVCVLYAYASMFILSIAMIHPLSHTLLSAWSPPMTCCDFGIWELQLSNYEIPSPEVTSLKTRAKQRHFHQSYFPTSYHTVGGGNPAPPNMHETL